MRKAIIILSALVMSSGVALADRHGGGGRGGPARGPVVQQHQTGGWNGGSRGGTWNGGSRGWSGGVNVSPSHERGWGGRPVVVNRGYDRGYRGYERRPIYVERPVIRHRYFDYRIRPQVIVENYSTMDGYIWIPGAWQWDGAEWIWQPGHYQPDAAYDVDYDGY